jgi:NADH-quinone oxidoreductase subunit J
VETAIFVVCAAIVLGGAAGVVVARNPVHSALSLVATLFGIAVLFLNLGAQLLAAVQVIVYTGAIVVLILFVLMLLGVDTEEDITVQPLPGQGVVAGIVAALIGAGVLSVLLVGGDSVVTGARSSLEALEPGFEDIRQIGQQLFTNYVFALEVTAALLTIAVVGAVVLSRRVTDVQPLPEPDSVVDEDDVDAGLYTQPVGAGTGSAAEDGD